jgi:dihydroflavonol-4-reductase
VVTTRSPAREGNRGRTVVVTGATGHLGANLVRQLLAAGRRVRVLVYDRTHPLEGLAVERFEGDVLDEGSLRRAFRGAEVVYHLAAFISIVRSEWPRLEAVNVGGTRNVVEACRAEGVRRLVHFSSIHALNQSPMEAPLDESRAPSDTGRAPAYDHSKARGEREVLAGVACGLDAVILNPTGVLGPFDFEPSRMGRVLRGLQRGTLPALVTGGFDWVDARDVAAAAMAAEDRGRCGERYLLSGTYLPVVDLAALVAEVSGRRAPRAVIPQWLMRPIAPLAEMWGGIRGTPPLLTRDSMVALRTGHPSIRNDKARAELGFAPRPLRDTIEDTLRWFSDGGRLAAEASR